MNNIKKFFTESVLGRAGIVASVVSVLTVCCAHAAIDKTGCEDGDNLYITPELALCSTHVYNIGDVANPKTDSDKQLMRDVVALKTTVMTQQMYKQYEYMDAMIRRFKTQLKKAVLTTGLQAAGAVDENGNTGGYSSSGSGGTGIYSSGDRNIYMAGVQNCNNELTNLKVFECLNSNLNSIYNSSNNGANITIELRKQLANDFGVAANASTPKLADKSASGNGVTVKDCTDYKEISQRKQFQVCLDSLRSTIRSGYETASDKNKQQQKQP